MLVNSLLVKSSLAAVWTWTTSSITKQLFNSIYYQNSDHLNIEIKSYRWRNWRLTDLLIIKYQYI